MSGYGVWWDIISAHFKLNGIDIAGESEMLAAIGIFQVVVGQNPDKQRIGGFDTPWQNPGIL